MGRRKSIKGDEIKLLTDRGLVTTIGKLKKIDDILFGDVIWTRNGTKSPYWPAITTKEVEGDDPLPKGHTCVIFLEDTFRCSFIKINNSIKVIEDKLEDQISDMESLNKNELKYRVAAYIKDYKNSVELLRKIILVKREDRQNFILEEFQKVKHSKELQKNAKKEMNKRNKKVEKKNQTISDVADTKIKNKIGKPKTIEEKQLSNTVEKMTTVVEKVASSGDKLTISETELSVGSGTSEINPSSSILDNFELPLVSPFEIKEEVESVVDLYEFQDDDEIEEDEKEVEEEEEERVIPPLDLNNVTTYKKTGRPKDGGEPLEKWVNHRFSHLIDKNMSVKKFGYYPCLYCKKIIDFEDFTVKYDKCHSNLYFHSKCGDEKEYEYSDKAEDEKEGGGDDISIKEVKFFCKFCSLHMCFYCESQHPSSDEHLTEDITTKCSKCSLYYHKACLNRKFVSDSLFNIVQGFKGKIVCPQHFCRTCEAEKRRKNVFRDIELKDNEGVKCIVCLASYHRATCIPAGSLVFNDGLMICPTHAERNKDYVAINEKRKRVGCVECETNIKPKEENVACKECPLVYHPNCVGYSNDSGLSLEDWNDDTICLNCDHNYPLYGQVVWFRQPGSCIWPARILYPKEQIARQGDEVSINNYGIFSIQYFGTQISFFDKVTPFTLIPFEQLSLDCLKKINPNIKKPAFLTAYEEASYFSKMFWSFRNETLGKPQPLKYTMIKKNTIRVNVKQFPKSDEIKDYYIKASFCICYKDTKNKTPCDKFSDCVNVLNGYECSDKVCKATNCQNRILDNVEERNKKYEIFETEKKGWGLKTKQKILAGSLILEYAGEVIDKKECDYRISFKRFGSPFYILQLSSKMYIDAEYSGNLSRFINHSCTPNCTSEIMVSNEGKQVAIIYAKEDIEANEELTFDYKYDWNNFNCNCGNTTCNWKSIKNKDRWTEICSKCKQRGQLILCEFGSCERACHFECIPENIKPSESEKWICEKHNKGKKRGQNSDISANARKRARNSSMSKDKAGSSNRQPLGSNTIVINTCSSLPMSDVSSPNDAM